MSDLFEPRKVEFADVRIWCRETLALFRRRLVGFVLISLVYFLVCWQANALPWVSMPFGILLCQVFLGALIVTAQAADEGRELHVMDYVRNARGYLVYLAVLSVMFFVIYAILVIVSLLITVQVPHTDYTGSAVYRQVDWLMPGLWRFLVLYAGIVVTTLWFLNPLITLHELGLKDAMVLARKGARKNELLIFLVSYVPYVVFVVLFLATELSLLLAFLAYPLFAILQYVSYRHVYLGRRENKPVPVQDTALRPV